MSASPGYNHHHCNEDYHHTQTVEDRVSNHDDNIVSKSHGSHATGLVHFSIWGAVCIKTLKKKVIYALLVYILKL